jgi:2-C-methyl-D-erythritol 4-phosphate cytidylyltransferase
MRVAGILAVSGWRWSLAPAHYLHPLAGEPLFVRSARGLSRRCERLAVVVPSSIVGAVEIGLRLAGVAANVVIAGPERWSTLRAVVTDLGPSDLIITHDVCRALATRALFDRVLSEASATGAAACAVPLAASVVESDSLGRVVRVVSNASLMRLQTPQAFVTGLLQDGFEAVAGAIGRMPMPPPDEVTAVQFAGGLVHVVEGESQNRELMAEDDFAWAESILGVGAGGA